MAKPIKLDHAGIAVLLKDPMMQRAINLKTDQVARNVERANIQVGAVAGSGTIALPVEVRHEVTDRARGTVTLAHPAGEAVQAKHGLLTKAAAQAGLEVKDG